MTKENLIEWLSENIQQEGTEICFSSIESPIVLYDNGMENITLEVSSKRVKGSIKDTILDIFKNDLKFIRGNYYFGLYNVNTFCVRYMMWGK